MSDRSIIMDELITAMSKHDSQRVIDIFTSSFNGYCYFAHEVLLNTSMQVMNTNMKDINESIIIDGFGTHLAYSTFMNIMCFARSANGESHPALEQIIHIYKEYRSHTQDLYSDGVPRIIITNYLHEKFGFTPNDIDEFIKVSYETPGDAMSLKLAKFVSQYFDKVDEYCLKFLNKEMTLADIESISKQIRFIDGILAHTGGTMFDV